ncbi:MAG: hypothetical protein ABEK10_01070 [Candidatus Nanosalina sp.]
MNTGSKIKFSAAIVLISLFLALAAINSKQGNTGRIFLYTLLAWTGYLTSHKVATGEFIDGKETVTSKDGKDSNMAPKNLVEYPGFITGATVFITGMIIGGTGVRTGEVLTTFGGGLLFTTGYVIAHWSTTGELL